mgnify:CR=1 FL=1
MTRVVSQNDFDIVCQALDNHKVVAFPTETVFGVGVKFNDIEALDALMEAKNRDYSKAITLMVYDKNDIEEYAYVNDSAKKIIDHFMPGMITLVLNKKECVDPMMTNGKDTIGILASVSVKCAEYNANVIDVSQTVINEYFAMFMFINIDKLTIDFNDFVDVLVSLGKERNLEIHVMHEEIFNMMHKI